MVDTILVLKADMKFKLPPGVEEQVRASQARFTELMGELEKVGNDRIKAELLEEVAEAAAAGPAGDIPCDVRSRAQIRDSVLAERRGLKTAVWAVAAEASNLIRPIVADFVKQAGPHIDAVEAAEKSECDRLGAPHTAGSLVRHLRSAVASLPGRVARENFPGYAAPAGQCPLIDWS